MPIRLFLRSLRVLALLLSCSFIVAILHAQGAKQKVPLNPIADSDGDHVKERNQWFLRGRVIRGKPSAELRRRAYQAKIKMRAERAAALGSNSGVESSSGSGMWTPIGPVPLASDASGNGTQDYHQVSGRATAVAIDPADSTGNTVFVGGAQAGVWKSTNATVSADSVTWTPLTDSQATLSIGAIAIQPGNSNVITSLVLAATGEGNSTADSYFGLGILRSPDGGNTWQLISTANNGSLSFSGLGGTRLAFSMANPNNSVAAMATTFDGIVDNAVTSNTAPGLYTSTNAGQAWTYNALLDPGGLATDATSATSVVYNAKAGKFFAAIRYHGFYSSPDGVTWTRLATQPGGAVLSTSACPPQSSSNGYGCPIYRGELTVVPGRNEMYAWYISLDSSGDPIDQFIWQSTNGGASWAQINDASITDCGDFYGCGVAQGYYNLELAAIPDGSATDLYAGAINLYKCSINTLNPTCAASPFLNLTHVYGCDPIAAPSHVHPDQHALAYSILSSGADLMYFANDGGIYRALDGFGGLTSGSCSANNQFDDLNQNLGPMTQFVSFSQHPTDPNTVLGGTQDNGSPATSQATTNPGWLNVLGGDGGYNAIDPAAVSNFYASNPDFPPGGLGIQLCTNGVNCNDTGFSSVVTSSALEGDDGAFYFPYILDPSSSSAMLVGTCRVWRGPRSGGAFTALSPNFDTLGSGTCTGSEVNLVRALAAAGPTDSNGSQVIYAATSGLGPIDGVISNPIGGHVWVTTNASAGPSAFADVTGNGSSGSINSNQFPISSVATDSSDATGNTAYVTIMGFTGGAGHVWKTTNAGASWSDFTANLPDAPVNAVAVYPALSQVYVATDIGVFSSSTSSAKWTELGESLPNVAVTALGVFNAGGRQLLRASTYGRGIWQFDLTSPPDFQVSLSNSPQTVSAGSTATFTGSANALNGYSNSITLTCTGGITNPPSTCTASPSSLTPAIDTFFTVAAGGAVSDYYFNITGSDFNQLTHQASAVLQVRSTGPDFILQDSTAFPGVNAGGTATGTPITISALNGFTGTVSLTCSLVSGAGTCSVSPNSATSFPATPNVTVNAANLSAGSYQMVVKGTSGATNRIALISFNVGDYQLSGPSSLALALAAQGTANLAITPLNSYKGNINASCNASSLPGATCTLNPGNPIAVNNGSSVPLTATITAPSSGTPGPYNIVFATQDTTGTPSHNAQLTLTLQDFSVSSATASQTISAGGDATYQLSVAPNPISAAFSSPVTLSCSGLPTGASCPFSPSTPVTPGSISQPVSMTIFTSSTTPVGTYTVTVTGSFGSLSRSVQVSLTVTAATAGHSLQLAVLQPFPAKVDAGTSQTARVSATPNYSGQINPTCDSTSMPAAQCLITPGNPNGTSGVAVPLTVTLNVPSNVTPGPYTINIGATGVTASPLSLPVAVIQDFTVSSETPSRTVSAGQTTGAYQLSVAPNPSGSSFPGAVTLSCSNGLPGGAQCLFNPSAPVTPGSTAQSVVMSISTSSASASRRLESNRMTIFLACLLAGIVFVPVSGRSGLRKRGFPLIFATLLLIFLPSCAGVSSGPGGSTGGGPATYTVTVTGISGGLTHSLTVQLIVE